MATPQSVHASSTAVTESPLIPSSEFAAFFDFRREVPRQVLAKTCAPAPCPAVARLLTKKRLSDQPNQAVRFQEAHPAFLLTCTSSRVGTSRPN